ncbi:MAG TPA: hypothetical protein VGQ83_00155 [Polyangia bacterium]|jgi:hypothetical protein
MELTYVAVVWRSALGRGGDAARFALLALCVLVPSGALAGLLAAVIARLVDVLVERRVPAGAAAVTWKLRAYTLAVTPLVGAESWLLFAGRHARTLRLRPILVVGCFVALGPRGKVAAEVTGPATFLYGR